MRVYFIVLVTVYLFIAKTAFAAKDSSFVMIIFKSRVGDEQLELGKTYNNPFNETFTVRRFKYYISNIAFHHTDGTIEHVPDSYFLVNEEDSASKICRIRIKTGSYNRISFLIGVDSIENVSGTQTDALDPMNGMFWTWNSGYIMAKLEATSPLSRSPNNLVEYHIGGFRSNQNTVRRILLSFPQNQIIEPDNNLQQCILIEADINKWFNGKHELKIAEHTACTTPGELAVKFADNYASMFTIASINYSCKEGLNE